MLQIYYNAGDLIKIEHELRDETVLHITAMHIHMGINQRIYAQEHNT